MRNEKCFVHSKARKRVHKSGTKENSIGRSRRRVGRPTTHFRCRAIAENVSVTPPDGLNLYNTQCKRRNQDEINHPTQDIQLTAFIGNADRPPPRLGEHRLCRRQRHHRGDPRIVTTYAELSSALSSGVTYVKLGANINTKDFNDGAGYTKSIQQTGTVQLDLDGYSVTFFSRTSPLPAAIRVTGDLSVKDSRGGGKLYIDANPNTASSKQVLILAETGASRSTAGGSAR